MAARDATGRFVRRSLHGAVQGIRTQPPVVPPLFTAPLDSVRSPPSSPSRLSEKRLAQAAKLAALPEVRQRNEFLSQLDSGACAAHVCSDSLNFKSAGLSPDDISIALEAGLATFLLHIESVIANQCGEAFYTIGPCGEELLSAVGLALRPTDAAALHYRHLSTSLTRALKSGKSMEQVLLDRARGFCISAQDPVGGGHHCLLGGMPTDFLVSSTLASQACPAVGRAAGLRLAHHLRIPNAKLQNDAVSYVSVGDGSVNNAHFLSAVNLAEYMQHRGFQCPVVFGISDNGICISLRNYDWLDKFLKQRLGMPVFRANANDLADVYRAASSAFKHARRKGAPAAVVFTNISRRFGHAVTDRQDAYLSTEEIAAAEDRNAFAGFCAQAVAEGITTYPALAKRFRELASMVEEAFDEAAQESKVVTREACVQFNSQPLVPKAAVVASTKSKVNAADGSGSTSAPQVMRKAMNRVLDELLTTRPELVYIGEDVQHGGYYRVTDGLHEKHGWRVADFPPDETSLLGVAMGYSQVGLVPIVEIPYAKYLDCGADMFYEAVVMNWLSAGKQPCGMVIRLQGFDKGVFGGNFHTHNSLYLPPGLDVVAYSNGADYARGMRYAVAQAAAGRVVMSVDSTDLLNRRHLFEKDGAWMRSFPSDRGDVMAFDEVRTYGDGNDLLIVTYGNGVPTALAAQKKLQEHGVKGVVVADSPYLSDVPKQLAALIPAFKAVVFADVCKQGQHPHAGYVVKLQEDGILPSRWRSVAAAPTYNPLGTTLTFLSQDDVVSAAAAIV